MQLNETRAEALDYMPCQYGRSKLEFRGPKRDIPSDFVLFIGGTETFGKFVARPYPALFEDLTGQPSINLAACNAGLDSFRQDATVIAMARRAQLVVIQAMGPQFLSNRYYSVHPRRNDRFVKATLSLRRAYPTIDFSEIAFVGHLLSQLETTSHQHFQQVVQEFQHTWIQHMQTFLGLVSRPCVVLWIDRPETETLQFLDRRLLAQATVGRAPVLTVPASTPAHSSKGGGLVFEPSQSQAAALAIPPNLHNRIAQDLVMFT
ncbi:MAG: hypothetical protein JXR13_09855 [Thalassovita sp.]